jgi:hypothetical protein
MSAAWQSISVQDLPVHQHFVLFEAFLTILSKALDHDMLLSDLLGYIYSPLHSVLKVDRRSFYDTFNRETVPLYIILFAF